jgi:hypothetical protein
MLWILIPILIAIELKKYSGLEIRWLRENKFLLFYQRKNLKNIRKILKQM